MDMESFLCISGDQISKELFQREADSGWTLLEKIVCIRMK